MCNINEQEKERTSVCLSFFVLSLSRLVAWFPFFFLAKRPFASKIIKLTKNTE